MTVLAVLLALYASFLATVEGRWQPKALEIPDWAVLRNNTEFFFEFERNIAAINAIDAAGQRMDVAMYGDSITAWNKPLNLTKLAGSRDVWIRYFGDLKAEPLGIPGDRITTLVWRLTIGQERPKLANPKVVIILIGINDIIHKTPDIEAKMEFLLRWLRFEMPDSQLVLQALLPGGSSSIRINRIYEGLAQKHRILYSTCMQDIRKYDKRYMLDNIHPNANGQDKLLGCLRALVQPLLDLSNQPTLPP